MAPPTMANQLWRAGIEQLGLGDLEGGKAFKRYVDRGAMEPERYAGPVSRLNNFMVMKYGFPVAATYTVASHELTVVTPSGELGSATYAFSYWRHEAEAPEYVCIGPTYTSQDGEYRRGMVWWPEFAEAYERPGDPKLAELLGLLELWFDGIADAGDARLDTYVYPAGGTLESGRVDRRARELRVPIRLLVAQVLFSEYWPLTAVHLNPGLAVALAALQVLSPLEFEAKTPLVARFVQALGTGLSGRSLIVGQKIIPMSVADSARFGDMRSPQWREIWAARMLSDTALNGRGHFPFFNQWTTIRGADEGLYENVAMAARYGMSAAARAAMEHLQVARRLALADSALAAHPRMQALDHEIHRGEQFAEESVILSSIALVTTGQHVGNTLGSVLAIPRFWGLPAFTGEGWLKLAFDLAFSCLAMHDTCCHADLHAQNATAYIWAANMPEPKACFYAASAHGEKDAFVAPAWGATAYIIDFSRAIINPCQRPALAREHGSDQIDMFFREQAMAVLATAERWLPGFAREHQEAIKGAALAYPQRAYNAVCLVDYLAVGEDFGDLAAEASSSRPWPEAVTAACARLAGSARRELVGRLRALIAGKDVPPPGEAGVRLLHELAPHWQFAASEHRARPLVDMLSAAAPMRSSGDDPATYPECARPAGLLAFAPGKDIADVLNRGSGALFTAFRERAAGEDAAELDVAVERMRALLSDAPPPRAAGSWLT